MIGRHLNKKNIFIGLLKVSIAVCLIYWVLSTGKLDLKTGSSLMDLFEKLNEDLNQTFLIATHNPQLAERVDKRFLIENGVIKTIA